MKRFIKVLFGFLFAIVLSSTLVQVQAAEADEAVLIYVEVPAGWDTPCIWTWDDDGTGAFANLGWPGKEMVEDDANAGWYYLYVPSSMTNVIVNANEGTVQTDAFTIAGENVWVTITETAGDDGSVFTGTTSTVQATVGELPEYVATKYIYAYVPIDWDTAAIWAWNFDSGVGVYTTWPGQEMDLQDDGWFMIEIPDTADRVIINNNDTDNMEQTVDLTVGTEDAYIYLGETNTEGKYEADVTDTKPIIIEGGYTLYITVPEEWTAPSLWAWSHPDGTGLYTTWPGEPITYNADSGYYEVLVPDWVNKVIINNGLTDDNAAQTVDGDLLTDEEQYIYVGDADDEGKFAIDVYSEAQDGSDDNSNNVTTTETVDDGSDTDETTIGGWIYGVVGGIVVVLAVGSVVLLRRKAA